MEGTITDGTGRDADIGRPAAGKTGTAQNYADATFVGYTPQRAAAVWVGFPEAQIPMVPPTTDIRVAGGTNPARIWREVMLAAHANLEPVAFSFPASIPTTTLPPSVATVEIPSLVGRDWDARLLTQELAELNLRIASVGVQSLDYSEGLIIGQAPPSGTQVVEGSTLTLEVATPQELLTIAMPDVVGSSEGEARGVLAAHGLGVEELFEVFFDETLGEFTGEPGVVWGKEPAAGELVSPGDGATIRVRPLESEITEDR